MKRLKVICFIGLLSFLGGGFYFYLFANSPKALLGEDGNTTKKIEFDLLRGMRPVEIGEALERANLVTSGSGIYWLGKITGDWGEIKAAEYELSPMMTPLQILKIFKSGIGIQHSIMVREGDNIFQVADSFKHAGLGSKEEVLRLLRKKELIAELGLGDEGIRSLEGYLFPNTYFYDKRDNALSIIRRMANAFLRWWTPDYEARARELGMTRKEVVVLASMVEKETGAGFERPIISSVFHNRLRKKIRLQSDPTTIYGMWERYSGNLHRSDLVRPSDYNTYTLAALPHGPIANPNPESIRAVLYPADTDYLYFVSKNDGTHVFSKSYPEHAEWVRRLQMNPAAREGKSWRNLKNK